MSIIEKAISKQRKTRTEEDERAGAVNTDIASEAGPSRVEQAMARVRPETGQVDPEDVAGGKLNGAAPAGADAIEQPTLTTQRRVEISRDRLAELGLIEPSGGRSQLAEEYRLVKRPILAGAFATGDEAIPHGNLVMVTSALPREGKSFSTINLAMSIAMEFDRTVLLVDADVARPSILGYLGVDSDGPGLLDLLADDNIDFPDALIRTDIDNLTLMPAGKTYPRANEMLASRDMEQLVAEMSARYPDRIILFDTPPLLATSEASVLAQHMGQVVFVVEAEHTPQDATVRAIEQLQGCEVVLPLLNKTKPLPGMGYAHGYYGSYYGT